MNSADLSAECSAFKQAIAAVLAAKAKAGPWPHREPPGSDYMAALDELHRCGEVLFSSPAKCADDVLRKYGMLEDYDYRSFNVSKFGLASNADAHWYAQLDADLARYSVDVNPWWRDGYPSELMIDGQEVAWVDGGFKPA